MKIRILVAILALGITLPTTSFAQVEVEAEIAERVVDRDPQNPGNAFPVDIGEVTAWTRVSGAEGTTIQHVWMHAGMEFPVSLEIDGTPWRTWSTKQIPPEWSGDWQVEIRGADGNVLDTLNFTVGAEN